jgi:hypothetical protein
VDNYRDQHGGRERDRCEATQEEERLRFVEPEAEPDDPAEGGEADGVEQQQGDPCPPAAKASRPPSAARPRNPHEGECSPNEERRGPCIGPVVEPRRIHIGLVKSSHEQA